LFEQRKKEELVLFRELGVEGGPTDPLDWFYDVEDESQDALYVAVKRWLAEAREKAQDAVDLEEERPRGSFLLEHFAEPTRRLLTIDDCFALYLLDLAHGVVVNFYKLAVITLFYLREFFNAEGWDVLQQYLKVENQPQARPLFTVSVPPAYIPYASNEFVLNYLPFKCPLLPVDKAAEIVQNLNAWLLNRELTNIKSEKVHQK
jgi:hypothetical protein